MWVLSSRDKYPHSYPHPGNSLRVRANELWARMSVRLPRGGWEVRWRDATGCQRARPFQSEEAARAFDEALAEVSPAARRSDTAQHGRSGGVYSYRTSGGIR